MFFNPLALPRRYIFWKAGGSAKANPLLVAVMNLAIDSGWERRHWLYIGMGDCHLMCARDEFGRGGRNNQGSSNTGRSQGQPFLARRDLPTWNASHTTEQCNHTKQ